MRFVSNDVCDVLIKNKPISGKSFTNVSYKSCVLVDYLVVATYILFFEDFIALQYDD